ncbi:MAG: hypothetical protein HGA76_07380, partial [Candidatus Firestonebacteria bacterium]|nr:hypothetical protein [Candidatus Firestonebacteria bacterium]
MQSASAPNPRPKTVPSPDATRLKKNAILVLAALLLLGLGWFIGGLYGRAGGPTRWQPETPEAARVATEFLTHYLTFSA